MKAIQDSTIGVEDDSFNAGHPDKQALDEQARVEGCAGQGFAADRGFIAVLHVRLDG